MQNKTAGRLSLGTDTAMAFMIGCLLIVFQRFGHTSLQISLPRRAESI